MPRLATLLGLAALTAGCGGAGLQRVVLTGQLQDELGHPPAPGYMSITVPSRTAPVATDSLGRFALALELPRGCHRALLRALGFVPVEWHFEVGRRDTLALGGVAMGRSVIMLEHVHLIAGCGQRDTLRPTASWVTQTRIVEP
jgi:hypothetical protein